MVRYIPISFLLNLVFFISLFSQSGKISSSLQNVLTHTPENEPIKVWIYFVDKGSDINNKLEFAKNNLGGRSKKRRSKMKDRQIVDRFDIPISTEYLQSVKPYIKKVVIKSKWLNAISAIVEPDRIKQIEQNKFVKKIDVVKKFRRHQPADLAKRSAVIQPENIYDYDYGSSYTQNEQINVPQIHNLGINGSGVLICVLDNNFNLLNHETFSSMNIISTWDFIHGDTTVNDPSNEGTHGTQTLSTVGGYSPGNLIGPAFGANFMLGKTEVSGSETPVEEDYWVAGAEWADSLGADIISSSLGYLDFDPPYPGYTWQDMDGNTAVTTIGADIAAAKGIVVVNSAGNEGSSSHNTLIAPADGDSVIAVAAVTSSGSRASFSSIGPSVDGRTKPDVAAMGSGVTVASPYNPSGYTSSSGTSFSCPLTSGVAALILSTNPMLTPMQVREALRETASQAANPDNLLGWGIINAYDAVFYFNAEISHSPLGDTEDLNGPYEVVAQIESKFPLIPAEIKLIYGNGTNFGNEMVMQPTGNVNEYSAQITGVGYAAEYFYYIHAENDRQITSRLPFNAPAEYFRFYAGADTNAPVITHNSLHNQALCRWPAKISAQISDNLGVDSAWVEFRINSGTLRNFALNKIADNTYEGTFPLAADSINTGDIFEYRIQATDNSSAANLTILPGTGYYQFEIINVAGLAIVIDDDQNKKSEKSSKKNYWRPLEKIGNSAKRFESVLQMMGYLVDNVSSSLIDTAALSSYDLIVSASGGENAPLSSTALRSKLENWVQSNPGHKLIIEGGEVGYVALRLPGYPSFAANVLHSLDWLVDNAGNLLIKPDQIMHPIATTPNQLPASITLSYTGWGDEDGVIQSNDAYAIFGVSNPNYSNAGSVIVYDDDQDTTNAQLVFLTFNVDALSDTTVANQLIENVVSYLLNPGTTQIEPSATNPVPKEFVLRQNYPNPFNPRTTIEYALPGSGNVVLSVFNILGQQVLLQDFGTQKAGWHKYNFNGATFSSGIYFYRLTVTGVSGNTSVLTRKMVFIQ